MENAQELVSYVIRGIVQYPDQVDLNVLEGTTNTVLEVHVAQDDIGRVIGKSGNRINSIRTLLSVVSSIENHNYELEIATT